MQTLNFFLIFLKKEQLISWHKMLPVFISGIAVNLVFEIFCKLNLIYLPGALTYNLKKEINCRSNFQERIKV